MSADELENRNFLARPVTIALGAVLLVALSAAVPSRAQDDVAEAARQARERKAAQQNSPRHVYTEEDLKKTRILTSEDTSRAVASRKIPSPPAPNQPQSEVAAAEQIKKQEKNPEPNAETNAQQNSDTPSLGEIARRYRQEKETKHMEQAAKSAQPSRYPLDLPKTSFAEPKATVAPSNGSLREDELRPLKPGLPKLAPGSAGARVAPFAPRRDGIARSFATAPLANVIATLQRKQVRTGESWWRLAQQYLGDGARWPELMRVNPGASRNPNRLLAGAFVFVPQPARAGTGPPGPKIVVRTGDTLWSLAREHLGCGQAWPRLAAANPEVTNFHQLQIGAILQLPGAAAPVCSAPAIPARK
jgi:nucleoid-associated protein YgaU